MHLKTFIMLTGGNEQRLHEDAYKQLVECILGNSLRKGEHFDRDCLIGDRLGITGIEAEQMLFRLEKQYGLDISKVNFAKHFCQEPEFLISFGPAPTHPLTIGHIERAVISGRLV